MVRGMILSRSRSVAFAEVSSCVLQLRCRLGTSRIFAILVVLIDL
jgi:hypothetical protein